MNEADLASALFELMSSREEMGNETNTKCCEEGTLLWFRKIMSTFWKRH